MHRDLKLKLFKTMVNVPARVLDKFITFPATCKYPQTRAIEKLCEILKDVYQLDVQGGTFGTHPDENFARLLNVCAKLLANITEDDPYYRQWVGLILWLASNEYGKIVLSPAEVKMCFDGDRIGENDDIPDRLIAQNIKDFTEMAICGHLSNLALMSQLHKTGGKRKT